MTVEEAEVKILEFSIIEHLVKRHCSNLQISHALGLWSYNDDHKQRLTASNVIDTYFVRYQRRLALIKDENMSKISPKKVRLFIISHKLGFHEYNNYLKKQK